MWLYGNAGYVILIAGPALLMVRWLTPGIHGTLGMFGIRRCELDGRALTRSVLGGMSLVMLLYAGWGLIAIVTGWGDPRDAWSHDMAHLWEEILFGCVVAPIVEEPVFRGFIFAGLRRAWGAGAAAVTSSALFAATHGYSLWGSAGIFVFGLLMCGLYRATGTLLVPMAVHALTNAILIFW
jgi:membrane protease YdiL (CAAX protease family)